MTDPRVTEAVQAIRSGEKREARRLLGLVVNDDPANVKAWWFLAAVLEDPEQRVEALQRVLALRPDHTEAQRLLAKLEKRKATITPPQGTYRPVIDAQVDAQGNFVAEPPPEPRLESSGPGDTAVAGAALIIALLAIIGTVILVWTGSAGAVLGIQGPRLSPTPVPVSIGVPACAPSDSDRTTLIFINNTAATIDVFEGPQDAEDHLLTLNPGEQGSVQTRSQTPVRYAVEPDADNMVGGGAILEVPHRNTCRVPVQ